MMWAKVVLVMLLLAMMVVLFRGLFFLVKDQGNSKRTVNALIWRVAFAVAVIGFLILSVRMGWLVPHALGR